jgi:dihydrolipoamide dehydrogenase
VVEKKHWGGVCLNIGCIPTKTLVRHAELAQLLKRHAGAFGINVTGELSFDSPARRAERVLTYEEVVLAERLPASMIVVGGGAIGVEFAYILRAYGVKVTIVEHLDRLLPAEDREVSTELRKRYERDLGMTVLTSTRVHTIEDTGPRARVTVTATGGAAQTLEADAVLRVEGYGLERSGVALAERGAIGIDEYMRTSVPHIYAIGDVTAKLMLAHVAEAMGVFVAEQIAGLSRAPLEFDILPRAT